MNIKTASMAEKIMVLFVIFTITIISLGFSVVESKEVTLVLDGDLTEVVTTARTVDDLIKSEDIEVAEGAYINEPLDSRLDELEEVIIKNPKNFTINDGGEVKEIVSIQTSVGELLEELDIQLGEGDFTYPELDDTIRSGSNVRIYRITSDVETQEVEIGYREEVVDNRDLPRGETRVVQEGVKGSKTITTNREYLNGVEISRKREETVTKNPVNKIIEKGTRDAIETNRGSLTYRSAMVMNASAYDDSPQSQGQWVGQTATGMKPQRGVVAVDPRVIPLGTKLYVQSTDGTADYGFAVAGDTGGAIKGNRIDLFHDTRAQCRAFGRRNVKVYILD